MKRAIIYLAVFLAFYIGGLLFFTTGDAFSLKDAIKDILMPPQKVTVSEAKQNPNLAPAAEPKRVAAVDSALSISLVGQLSGNKLPPNVAPAPPPPSAEAQKNAFPMDMPLPKISKKNDADKTLPAEEVKEAIVKKFEDVEERRQERQPAPNQPVQSAPVAAAKAEPAPQEQAAPKPQSAADNPLPQPEDAILFPVAQQALEEASSAAPAATPDINLAKADASQQTANKAKLLETTLAKSGLIDVETLPMTVFLDMRYATEDNFTGKQLYSSAKCYLKKPAAQALAKAAQYALESKNSFFLCIYDCYRPPEAQKELWEIMPVSGLVANPDTGSNHSRGTAIDLAPCNSSGQELEMPTGFDEFGPKAEANATEGISDKALHNRQILQDVMTKAGFSTIKKEWWHFNYRNYQKEPVIKIVN